MGNKSNFSQAMREILGMDASEKTTDEKVSTKIQNNANEDLKNVEEQDKASRLNRDFNIEFSKKEEVKPSQSTSDDNIKTEKKESVGQSSEPAFYEKIQEEKPKRTFSGNFSEDVKKFDTSFTNENKIYEEPTDEAGTTIITRNTVVEGNIKSFENIELNGKVKGTISTTKNVGVSGYVQGDIEATDVLLEGAQIKGDIDSKGALLMDKDTLLVGNVDAQNTRVDGKIKGEINVGGNGEFLSNSVVVGNITVSNFYVQYGARMQGYIDTNFSKNEEDSIFERIAGSN